MAKKKAPRRSSKKVMRGRGSARTIKPSVRKRTATVRKKANGGTKYMFPMPDAAHARNAMARLNQAKGMTLDDKKKVARRAKKFLGETPAIKKILSR